MIQINPNTLLTNHILQQLQLNQNQFHPSLQNHHLKIPLLHPHHLTPNIPLPILKPFHLKHPPIPTTIPHHSHNILPV
ncbi:adenine deaminase C-terminal domain-containing protein, partial [Priestia megaterium]|uniref:adenine deaminase C-terminal domain-containing protein n=1 Tax=Priestia megaterium TaxID=1404 RepID=UPI003709555C